MSGEDGKCVCSREFEGGHDFESVRGRQKGGHDFESAIVCVCGSSL